MATADIPRVGRPDQPDSSIEREILEALKAELAEERARKESIERRGLAVAAAAATSTALLFGLGSRYTGIGKDLFFLVLLGGGLAFLGSAAMGWRTTRLLDYSEMKVKEFDRILDEGWPADERELVRYLAAGVYDTIVASREKTKQKVKSFGWSLGLLLTGAILVGIELVFVVVDQIAG